MKRFKHIINEVKELEKYQAHAGLIKYLKQEFGLHVDTEVFMNYIDIYTGDLRDDNTDVKNISKDKISENILKFFNAQDYMKKAEAVWVTEYGYVIVLETDADIMGEKMLEENTLYYYYYDDGVMTNPNSNDNLMMMSHGKQAFQEKQNKKVVLEQDTVQPDEKLEEQPEDGEVTKQTVETDTSNIVLDHKFVWFFNVLDENEVEVGSGIMELEEAIEILINEEATMIIALPYVDPSPENDAVDLVFADNPGPVIIYDGR